jgi:hypothetical protein
MSLKESSKTNLPRLCQLTEKPKLIIPENVYCQIDYLCKNIDKVEWSGVLFYKCTGSLLKPETLSFELKYILPMDKGTSGYTSYDFDTYGERIMEKPELLEHRIGHIHSHHSMQSFFSGTDNEELQENAPNYDHYLSLIVNNNGDYVARVAFMGKIKNNPTYTFKYKNKVKNISKSTEEEVVFYYDLDIEVQTSLDEFFLAQVDEIQKPKVSVYNTNNFANQSSWGYDDDYLRDIDWDGSHLNNKKKNQSSEKNLSSVTTTTELNTYSNTLLNYLLKGFFGEKFSFLNYYNPKMYIQSIATELDSKYSVNVAYTLLDKFEENLRLGYEATIDKFRAESNNYTKFSEAEYILNIGGFCEEMTFPSYISPDVLNYCEYIKTSIIEFCDEYLNQKIQNIYGN